MTDGIIAFDMEGNIIHINPAAIQLLNLTDEKNTFNSIFTKFNTDINLENSIFRKLDFIRTKTKYRRKIY